MARSIVRWIRGWPIWAKLIAIGCLTSWSGFLIANATLYWIPRQYLLLGMLCMLGVWCAGGFAMFRVLKSMA